MAVCRDSKWMRHGRFAAQRDGRKLPLNASETTTFDANRRNCFQDGMARSVQAAFRLWAGVAVANWRMCLGVKSLPQLPVCAVTVDGGCLVMLRWRPPSGRRYRAGSLILADPDDDQPCAYLLWRQRKSSPGDSHLWASEDIRIRILTRLISSWRDIAINAPRSVFLTPQDEIVAATLAGRGHHSADFRHRP